MDHWGDPAPKTRLFLVAMDSRRCSPRFLPLPVLSGRFFNGLVVFAEISTLSRRPKSTDELRVLIACCEGGYCLIICCEGDVVAEGCGTTAGGSSNAWVSMAVELTKSAVENSRMGSEITGK